MLTSFTKAILLSSGVLMTALTGTATADGSDKLCSIPPGSYAAAMKQYPELAFAINEVNKRGIAAWYTDNSPQPENVAKQLVSSCDPSTRITLVVYGMPNKDCEHGYSNQQSTVRDPAAYETFIKKLVDIVGDRKILYVLEPDAVGLLANGGCGASAGYQPNLEKAISLLSANKNAEIYMDVGYWTLADSKKSDGVIKVVKDLNKGNNVKGITLNTSNYRSTSEMSGLCSRFKDATGMHCVIDTSRNFNGGSPNNEWCNAANGGIGHPPTGNTGVPSVDYFIWIKPPGESDGQCNNGGRSGDSLQGPAAGGFFKEHFELLWNNGYYVKKQGLPPCDGKVRPVSDPPAAVPQSTLVPSSSSTSASTPTPQPSNTGNGVSTLSIPVNQYFGAANSSSKYESGAAIPLPSLAVSSTPTTTAAPTTLTSLLESVATPSPTCSHCN